MRRIEAAIALAGCLLLAACSSLDELELLYPGATRPARALPDCAIGVQGSSSGRGAIVGTARVLTVEHVVGLGDGADVAGTFLWTRARVARRWTALPESVVELELPVESGAFGFEGFEEARAVSPGSGTPTWVVGGWTRAWGERLYPGDSGSPVLDDGAALVGLVYGETTDHRPVRVKLPAALARSRP